MPGYASGKHAYGICDRTGFRYKLEDLIYEVQHGVRTGLRVGKDVLDPDQPQNFLGDVIQQTRNLYLTHAQMLIREEVYLAGILFGTRLNIW